MNKFLIGLFLIAVAFIGSHYLGKQHVSYRLPTVSFKPTDYPATTRPFVVVVIGYNNGAYLAKTLESISTQNYSNFRLVYIDDGSTDGSFDLAKVLVYDTDKKVSFLRNEQRLGVLANLSQVVNDSLDDEIVVVVSGEDWLAHEWVLARLNQYYANPDLWLTFGQFCEFPSFTRSESITPSRDKPFKNVRLNTFYAGLFKEIGLDDFFEGEFIANASTDMAYLIPMLEMAEGHSTFIPEVFYISNSLSTVKDDPEILAHLESTIRKTAAYEPLSRWGERE